MAFILTDISNKEHELQINSWNWRPTLNLIGAADLVGEEKLELMGENIGIEVTQEEAQRIGTFLQEKIVPGMQPNERIQYDLTLTAEPDTGELYRDDLTKNYSVSYDWLKEFAAFCLSCKGFIVR